jgi:hypothetical protein
MSRGEDRVFESTAVVVNGLWTPAELSELLDKGAGSRIACDMGVAFPFDRLHEHPSFFHQRSMERP